MSDRDGLFTIGEFSKITGVGIHSLRYYDEIGALTPAYVDPVSNYRYYSFDQISTIFAINICKDAGIKLSRFTEFINGQNIDYDRLLDDSRDAINRKILEYRSQKMELERIRTLLKAKPALSSGSDLEIELSGLHLWAIPADTVSLDGIECDTLVKIASHAKKYGFQTSPKCSGIMRRVSGGRVTSSIFSSIEAPDPAASTPEYAVSLPAGMYRIRYTDSCSLASAESLLADVPGSIGSDYILLTMMVVSDNLDGPIRCAAFYQE